MQGVRSDTSSVTALAGDAPRHLPLKWKAIREGKAPAALFTGAKKKRQKDTSSLCLRPYLRDSLPPLTASGCPFGVRDGPHFPKCRPDPILLPESFCIPLRRRGPRGLSRYPSSDPDSVFPSRNLHFPCMLTKKRGILSVDFVQIEYSIPGWQSQAISRRIPPSGSSPKLCGTCLPSCASNSMIPAALTAAGRSSSCQKKAPKIQMV